MRVLQVSAYYASRGGGIEIVAEHLGRALIQRGHEVQWAASDHGEDLPEQIHAVPMPGTNWVEDKLHIPYPVWGLAAMKRLRAAVAWADVVHIHDSLYLGCQGAFWAAGAEDKPVILTQHIGEVPYSKPHVRFLMHAGNWLFAQPALKLAHVVVFISSTVRDYFGSWAGAEKTALVYNGVDQKTFCLGSEPREQVRRGLGIAGREKITLFVGRFVEKKRVNFLRPLAEQHPELSFRFIGRGPLDPTDWNLPNVKVLGHIPQAEIAQWYRAADLLVLPSVGEGFPLVVQEAMSCGLPCLVSEEIRMACPPAAKVMLSAGAEGRDLTAAFDSAIRDETYLGRMRGGVANTARELWNWSNTAAQYEHIYRGLIQ